MVATVVPNVEIEFSYSIQHAERCLYLQERVIVSLVFLLSLRVLAI